MKYDTHVLVDNKFQLFPRKHNRISRSTSNTSNTFSSPYKFLIKLKHHLSHDLSDIYNFSKVSLLAVNKYNLKITVFLL